MSDIAIKVENLSKLYRIGVKDRGLLSERISHGIKSLFSKNGKSQDPTEFWALRDISFEIKKGEAVGIIGRNGAGKSTLLKILSRITEPTSGRVMINGRVASLLEVGTGFHPELTGRENIFMNGAILGMKQTEIKRKFDEIVDFSGIEKFIDTPVKHYSSGMYVRLAFAVAAHLEPEVLIVDEVLAVGDAEFQKKCLGKMEGVAKNEGRTVLFVSHNMSAMSFLCKTGIVFENGVLSHIGEITDSITFYLSKIANTKINSTSWKGCAGDDSVKLLKTSVFSLDEKGVFHTGADICVEMLINIKRPLQGLVCGFELLNGLGHKLAYCLYDDYVPSTSSLVRPQKMLCKFIIPKHNLAYGNYRIVFDVGVHNVKRIIRDEGSLSFSLISIDGLGARFLYGEHGSVFRPNWALPAIQTQGRLAEDE